MFVRYHARDICIVSTSVCKKGTPRVRPRPFKWHVLDERNFLLFPGRPILQKHEADRGRDLHAHELCDVEIRHRRLGHQREWLPPRHHSRQGSKWVFVDANHFQLIRGPIDLLTRRNADPNANVKFETNCNFSMRVIQESVLFIYISSMLQVKRYYVRKYIHFLNTNQ